jgi:transposase
MILAAKAEEAGRELIAVDPRHTSVTCAHCGHVDQGSRVSQAVFRCTECSHQAHADINAACNVLRLGLSRRNAAKPRARSRRAGSHYHPPPPRESRATAIGHPSRTSGQFAARPGYGRGPPLPGL